MQYSKFDVHFIKIYRVFFEIIIIFLSLFIINYIQFTFLSNFDDLTFVKLNVETIKLFPRLADVEVVNQFAIFELSR